MADDLQTTLDKTPSGAGEKPQRQCYSREKKLEVTAFYQLNNLYQTAQKFSLNTKTILCWHKDREIKKSRKGSKRVAFKRSALFPDIDE